MTSRYRLVLLDLDGTLLTSSRTIHPATLRALRGLMERGVRVAFATGRSPASAAAYADIVKPNAPCVHMNGGLVRDYATGRVIFQRTLTPRSALAVLSAARDIALHWNVYIGNDIWIERTSATQRESEIKDGVPHVLVPDLVARIERESIAPLKIMLIASPDAIPLLTGVVETVLKRESGSAHLVNSEPTYLEALPLGCSKGDAARALVEDLGLAMSDVIAFGDNLNDMELLTSAGLGVAMANAHDDVLRAVPVHIGHHDTDAIAQLLDGFDVVDGALVRRINRTQ